MIVESDRVDLPSGVSVDGGYVEDVVRGCSWPLNDSGAFVLGCVGTPLDAVVRDLAGTFSLPLDVARRDVLRFIWMLNSVALVNVVHGGSRLRRCSDWLGLAARLVPAGALPTPLARRRSLDTRSVPRALVSSLRAAGSRVIAVATGSTIALLPLSAALGGRGDAYALVLALGAGTGLGLGLHEAGHVVSLRGIPSALVLRGRRTFVLHAPLGSRRRSLVALAGPAGVVAVGLALVAGGAAIVAPSLVVFGLPLTSHALSLTVVGGDGRAACGI